MRPQSLSTDFADENAIYGPDEPLTLDAVEFCRILSCRSAGNGLLAQQVFR